MALPGPPVVPALPTGPPMDRDAGAREPRPRGGGLATSRLSVLARSVIELHTRPTPIRVLIQPPAHVRGEALQGRGAYNRADLENAAGRRTALRKLNAPHLGTAVYDGVVFPDGVRAIIPTRKLRAA